jgi:GntR family transcriptional regulator
LSRQSPQRTVAPVEPSTNHQRPAGARYREIERYLRDLVDRSRPGDALPSEASLCATFGVSRMTVRQALQELTNAGLVDRRRGQGTFVASRPVHRRADVFLSFTEEMERRGLHASARVLSSGLQRARPEEQRDLGLSAGDEVVRIVRARFANGIPLALEDAALPAVYATVLGVDLEHGSLHRALEAMGPVATRALGTITARLARSSEVSLLDLPPHAALLVEVRTIFDQDGRAFERTETRYAADRYVIDVHHAHP